MENQALLSCEQGNLKISYLIFPLRAGISKQFCVVFHPILIHSLVKSSQPKESIITDAIVKYGHGVGVC